MKQCKNYTRVKLNKNSKRNLSVWALNAQSDKVNFDLNRFFSETYEIDVPYCGSLTSVLRSAASTIVPSTVELNRWNSCRVQ